MGEGSTSGSRDESGKYAIEGFLRRGVPHADEAMARPAERCAPVAHVGWRRAVTDLMFSNKPSAYSSLVARDSQRGRFESFSFNGIGR